MNDLKGKTALVTGAAKNLGRSIAIHLATKGAKVAVHYHTNKVEAEKTLSEVNRYSGGISVNGDVTDSDQVNTLFDTVEKKLGTVEILINLVGNFIYEPISLTSLNMFRDVIESNVYSSFLCGKRALPGMVTRNWGRIINFGCAGAESITIREHTTPYYIAKTGVIMLTKILAADYAKCGITVNTISPGILKTSIVKLPTPSGRTANFEDILNAIDFLVKDESNYINGANIEVSGGWRPGIR